MRRNPRWPIFIPSKSRADTALTPRFFDSIGVPYRIIVEQQQRDDYAQHFDPATLLVLDPKYQQEYDPFDELGTTKPLGPGPARNMAWELSIAEGASWHWVIDDNVRTFQRLNHNVKMRVGDGSCFAAMEDFAARFSNVAMAGPNYSSFAKARQHLRPFVTGTRIYSCNLIRNSVPLRWRGRYNEDTDLSLRMLKAGWATVQFNAFLQEKMRTQTTPGGNTEAFYAIEGTVPKSRMLRAMHPDVTRLTFKFKREHHTVSYAQWREQALIPDPDHVPDTEWGERIVTPGTDDERTWGDLDNRGRR